MSEGFGWIGGRRRAGEADGGEAWGTDGGFEGEVAGVMGWGRGCARGMVDVWGGRGAWGVGVVGGGGLAGGGGTAGGGVTGGGRGTGGGAGIGGKMGRSGGGNGGS